MTGPGPSIRSDRPGAARSLVPSHIRRLVLIFCLALAARAGWGMYRLLGTGSPATLEFPDETQYWQMAESLRAGDGLRDELGFQATRMPLFPLLLSLFVGSPRGIGWFLCGQWVIGAIGAALAMAMATRLFDARVGLWAGVMVALDPFLVFFSTLVLTETFFITALLGLGWLSAGCLRDRAASTRRWVGLGVTAALCVYLRESSLGLVLLLLGLIALHLRCDRRALGGALLAGSLVVLSLVPWGVRNGLLLGDWCWLTTRAGISLYDGVRPNATGESDLGTIKQMPAVVGLSEVEWNRYFLRQSIQAIKAEPSRIAKLAAVKLGRMWNPVPNVETYRSRGVRAVSALWTLPTFALALAGAVGLVIGTFRFGRAMAVFLLLPAVYLSVVHSLFIGSVRYRLGAVPFLEILAALALVTLTDRVIRPRPGREQSGAVA
ncbi:MAG: glycosyltransferase family 39 protein [Phycisphaerae bacterium]